MDPPPQAHAGVGHGPEYSMPVYSGQLTVTMWTEGDLPGQRAPEAACASSLDTPPTVASAAV